MKDVNGGEFREGGYAQLLCEVIDIERDHIRLRVVNSTHELAVGARHDEVFDGLVADSELTAFDLTMAPRAAVSDDQADGVKMWPME